MSGLGKPIKVVLNSYMVKADDLTKGKYVVYRYDIKYDYHTAQIAEKEIPRPVKEKIWNAPQLQSSLKGSWLYDGNALAW
jgi:hypothetical protein